MMTNRARIAHKRAWLGQQFGEDYARRLFGDEIVDSLPRYVRCALPAACPFCHERDELIGGDDG